MKKIQINNIDELLDNLYKLAEEEEEEYKTQEEVKKQEEVKAQEENENEEETKNEEVSENNSDSESEEEQAEAKEHKVSSEVITLKDILNKLATSYPEFSVLLHKITNTKTASDINVPIVSKGVKNKVLNEFKPIDLLFGYLSKKAVEAGAVPTDPLIEFGSQVIHGLGKGVSAAAETAHKIGNVAVNTVKDVAGLIKPPDEKVQYYIKLLQEQGVIQKTPNMTDEYYNKLLQDTATSLAKKEIYNDLIERTRENWLTLSVLGALAGYGAFRVGQAVIRR